ncbi:MAG: MFS transporter [Acidimicrobiales bacterium]
MISGSGDGNDIDHIHDINLQSGLASSVWAPHRRPLTVGLVLTITLVGFESLAVATVLPAIERDLGDLYLYGWVFSAYFLGSLLGIVIAGQLTDRFGPIRPFALGLVLFSIGLIMGGLAPSMAALVLARVIQGIGSGAIPAVVYASIGRSYAEAVRPRMFAILSSAWILPSLLGPVISASIADHWSWRWVFLGLLPLVALSGTLTLPSLRLLTPSTDSNNLPIKVSAAIKVTIGSGLVIGGLSIGATPLAALPLIGLGVIMGFKPLQTLVPKGTLRAKPGLPATILSRAMLTYAFFAADAYVPLSVTSIHHTSTTMASVALTAAGLAWAIGSWVQERKVTTWGPKTLIRTGFALVFTGITIASSVFNPSAPLALIVIGWGFAGLGMGLAYAPISFLVLQQAESGREGSASSSMQLADVLGIAFGAGLGGALIAIGEALDWTPRTALAGAFLQAGFMALLGFSLTWRLPASRPTGGS